MAQLPPPRYSSYPNRRGRPRPNTNQNSAPYRPRDFSNTGDIPPFKPGPALLPQSNFPSDPIVAAAQAQAQAQAQIFNYKQILQNYNPSFFPQLTFPPVGLDPQRPSAPHIAANPWLLVNPNSMLANQYTPLMQHPLQYPHPAPSALNPTPFLATATSVQSLTGAPIGFPSAPASSLHGPPLTSFVPKSFLPNAQTTQFGGFSDPNSAISATTATHVQPPFPFIPSGLAAVSAPSYFPAAAALPSATSVSSAFDVQPLADINLSTSANAPRSSSSPTFASPTIYTGNQSASPSLDAIVSRFAARDTTYIQSDLPPANHLPLSSGVSSESMPAAASDSPFSFGDFETGLSEVEREDAQRVLHAAPTSQTTPFESSGASVATPLVFRSSPTSIEEFAASYPVFSNGDPISRFSLESSLSTQPSQPVVSSYINAPRVPPPVATAAQSNANANADQQLPASPTQAAPAAPAPSSTAPASSIPAARPAPKAQPKSWAALVSGNPTEAPAQVPTARPTASHIPSRSSEVTAPLASATSAEGTTSNAAGGQSQASGSEPHLSRPAAVNGDCDRPESDKSQSPLDCIVLSPAPDKPGGSGSQQSSPKGRLGQLIRSDPYLWQLRYDLTRLQTALEANQSETLRSAAVPGVYPRGLVNRGNWCFANAVLQALLAVPPFLYLMDSITVIPSLHAGISPAAQPLSSQATGAPTQLETQSDAAAIGSASPTASGCESTLALSRTIDAIKHLVTCFQRYSPADVPERESTERHGGRGEKQPSRREVLIEAKLREAEQNAIDPTRLEVNLCEAIAELGIGTLHRSPTSTAADAATSLAFTRTSTKQRVDDELSFNVHQEDAEDFYSRLVNALNEEMARLLRPEVASGETVSSAQSDPSSSASEHFSELAMSDGLLSTPSDQNGPVATITETDDGEWSQVVSAARNKSVIVRDGARQKVRTPVSELLLGELRSNVERVGAAKAIASPGSKQDSANVQPFCTLQLEIQNNTIRTLQDALRGFSLKESLSTEEMAVASGPGGIRKWQTLESLPPVLVFHLKCFVYDTIASGDTASGATSDASRKICKQLSVPEALELQREMIGPSLSSLLSASASSGSGTSRESNPLAYSLSACVYHKGRRVNGGHYTTLIYNGALGIWLYLDDDGVQRVTDAQLSQLLVPAPRPIAGRPSSGRPPKPPPPAESVAQALRMDDTTMPYLLFYVRNDCQVFRRVL